MSSNKEKACPAHTCVQPAHLVWLKRKWAVWERGGEGESERKRESSAEQSSTKPWRQCEISVMSEEGWWKGRGQLSWNSCNTYLAVDRQEGIVRGSSSPVGNSEVKGFNTNPREISRELIRGRKKILHGKPFHYVHLLPVQLFKPVKWVWMFSSVFL